MSGGVTGKAGDGLPMSIVSRSKRLWLWCEITEVGEDGVVSRFVPVEELFADRHFDAEIVVLCVRWYLSFKLSYRDWSA